MAKAVQVHMSTPSSNSQWGKSSIHQLTWVPITLRPTKGMIVETKGDSRPWTIVAPYSIPQEIDGLAGWTEVARVPTAS
jgi:hypothetical protein